MSGSGPVVFVEAQPFSWTWFAGIPRYTARLTIALARRVPIRFFAAGQEIFVPANLDWSQDQDLERWARRIWKGKRRPLDTPPAGSLGLYCGLRPEPRAFPFEASVLHDLCPLILPWTTPEEHRAHFERYFARDLVQSDLVLAVSHSTRDDALRLLPLEAARIVVVPSGPSLCIDAHRHPRPVERSAQVGLVVSTIEPRKNAQFLVDWFHSSPVLPRDMELWWVGKRGWLTSRNDLARMARRPGGRRVRFLGQVSDARLCQLYQRASWSILPSLYEGFGFPVLDSLRHGTPVLTSLNSALREFDHPGVTFFDPGDPATVDRAWRTMAATGLRVLDRAVLDRLYHWDRVAEALLDAHSRAPAIPAASTHAA
jgi:glycosyltransferase involved in cell wall biosynthesis